MAEIVNLRRVRKAKLREVDERKAAENRLLHGRSKAERERIAGESRAADRAVAGHRLDGAISAEPRSGTEPGRRGEPGDDRG